ncbi:MAG: beta-lactamase family protein, partial [Actinobacteria bacterium]|nr:beta-lactamase family protein [Actinomycetota bacterium]
MIRMTGPPDAVLRSLPVSSLYRCAADSNSCQSQPRRVYLWEYFPLPESKGGWRTLDDPDSIRRLAGMDPDKLTKLGAWLRQSDDRDFAAVVIRRGFIVLQEERGNSAVTDSRRVGSCSKAVCATVLAIASEQSQQGHLPRKMSFDDHAFDFIPGAKPLSDPRKAGITVKQLLNHTSGICPEATGAPNDGSWACPMSWSGCGRRPTASTRTHGQRVSMLLKTQDFRKELGVHHTAHHLAAEAVVDGMALQEG